MARAWDDESMGRRAWRASPLVEVRDGRYGGSEGREPGRGGERKREKRVKAEEKAGKGSETMSRVARSD